MDKIYDCIVIGSGPAGMTAALYLKRSNKDVLIIEKETIGGQISMAPCVENFPTIEKISGSDLADRLFTQITDLGVEFELDNVLIVNKIEGIFHVKCEYNDFKSRTVIVATGAKHRMIGIPNEEDWIGNGFSYCVSCDGAFFKGEEVAVIGDANSALQYAIELSNYCPTVHVCTLFDKFFGDKILIDRLLSKPNVKVYHNIMLKAAHGNEKLERLEFVNTKTNEEFDLAVKGAFIAIGQVPNNDIIKNLVDIDKAGYVIADESLTTKTTGLFVAGDCRTKAVRQATTAVGDGAVAATACIKYLD